MTAQEKAKELVENFRLNVLDYEGCSINEHKAKQCAKIAVEEILKVIEDNCLEYDDNYWQEVKKELELL